MPFTVPKKTQLTTRVGDAIANLTQVENVLLSGARDAAVTDGERLAVYRALQQLIQHQADLLTLLSQV